MAFEKRQRDSALETALKIAQAPFPALFLILLAVGLNLPWPLEPPVRAALPFLALPAVHWTAYRAPRLLPSPLVLAIGLLADIAADAPLGYWPLLLLSALATGRAMRHVTGGGGPAIALAVLPVYALVVFALAMIVPALYTLQWPDSAPILSGLGLALLIEASCILILRLVSGSPSARHAVQPAGGG